MSRDQAKKGLASFLISNPFRISPKNPARHQPPKPQTTKPQPITQKLNINLTGTLPGIGAFLEETIKGGETIGGGGTNEDKPENGSHNGVENKIPSLLLIGKNIQRWRLTNVTSDSATFRRGRDRTTLYLTFGPLAKTSPQTPAPKSQPKPQGRVLNSGTVQEAAPSQEGTIPAELVNSLVQNPFDELKRIRMRPNDKSGGLEVQWIQQDSILRRLGVRRGDVIRSVNGIPFTNMGDIANSINSLMNSERFDVEVIRGGKPAPLRYVVK